VPAKADRATVKFEGTTETRSEFVEWPLPARPAPKPFVAAALQVRRETHGEGDRERQRQREKRGRELVASQSTPADPSISRKGS
jgi:hypothetical protein